MIILGQNTAARSPNLCLTIIATKLCQEEQKLIEPLRLSCHYIDVNSIAPSLQEISDLAEQSRSLVANGMVEVDQLIVRKLASEVALINQVSGYIINNGGKRLRPQLVLLAAGCSDYRGGFDINVAAIIEFIHTATLLHDDVVDESSMRRGRDTANSVWGNEAAVLVGDFLYSRSFEMMVEVGNPRVMEILAATTNRIAEGEVLQLLNVHEPDITEAQYLEVVRAKTAKLFEAAARLGGVLSAVDQTTENALAAYGRHLGTAFQIADDVLDYSSDATQMGKNVGDDLAEGKTTLPLIFAMQRGDDSQRELIRQAIREGGLQEMDQVMKAVNETEALTASIECAKAEAQQALTALDELTPNPYRDALAKLADFAVARVH